MAKRKMKKYQRGAAVTYISRNRAIRKLQLSIKDFRRLTILKGIYPVEPNNKKKANKGSTVHNTFYYQKDIQHLLHEPLRQKFYEQKAFLKKFKKMIGRNNLIRAKHLWDNKPSYTIGHIVKERYPSMLDALRDMDDALCMLFVFALLPQELSVKSENTQLCRRLTAEWMNFVIISGSLRKVFISIKGYYYQAIVSGETVTWLVPHRYSYEASSLVDLNVIATFAEFYMSLVGFVLFKLYADFNLYYPPKIQGVSLADDPDVYSEKVASLVQEFQSTGTSVEQTDELPPEAFIDDAAVIQRMKQEQELTKTLKTLFKGIRFYVNREVPRQPVVFIIRCFGGEVSWDPYVAEGSTFLENDDSVDYQIVDRSVDDSRRLDRKYVQPQWLFDSVNARMLLPVTHYVPDAVLPPHLSPFVTDGEYCPPGIDDPLDESDEDQTALEQVIDSPVEDALPVKTKKSSFKKKGIAKTQRPMQVTPGSAKKVDAVKLASALEQEETRMKVSLLSKKKKKMYDMLKKRQGALSNEAKILTEKRKLINKSARQKKPMK